VEEAEQTTEQGQVVRPPAAKRDHDEAVPGRSCDRRPALTQLVGDARAGDAHHQRGQRVNDEEAAHDMDPVRQRVRRHEGLDRRRPHAAHPENADDSGSASGRHRRRLLGRRRRRRHCRRQTPAVPRPGEREDCRQDEHGVRAEAARNRLRDRRTERAHRQRSGTV